MHCPKCAAEVREGARLCQSCGISLEEYGVVRDPFTEDKGRPPAAGGMAAPVRRRMIIAFVVFDIILAVVLVFFILKMG
ncbi:hypothetical protein BMS3Abin01_01176 [bacterium BMS3Abin01]|nr:hypothetical protein BMS3Abin01_01176 [bacterium BMS3Abin01]